MRVLFLGEYSGVFQDLIVALNEQGIETFLVSDGDIWRNRHSDFLFKNDKRHSRIVSIFLNLSGLFGLSYFMKQWPSLKPKVQGYDIVQMNSDYPLRGCGWLVEFYFLHYVFRHNKKIYMSALGDDYVINKWLRKNNYAPFMFFNNREKIKYAIYQYLMRRMINSYSVKHAEAICPGTYFYKCAYMNLPKTNNTIFPFPLGKDKIGKPLQISKDDQIVIFHGWQLGREREKGNDVFDRVIKRVVNKYGSRVKYIVVKSAPYDEYCKFFSSAHLFIDQLYADDKGMNGLLGMAAGKVVFSGFMPEALAEYQHYKNNIVGIRAYANDEYLFGRFCELIDNPKLMEEISRNAIDFVVQNHLSTVVVNQYIDLWTKMTSKEKIL